MSSQANEYDSRGRPIVTDWRDLHPVVVIYTCDASDRVAAATTFHDYIECLLDDAQGMSPTRDPGPMATTRKAGGERERRRTRGQVPAMLRGPSHK